MSLNLPVAYWYEIWSQVIAKVWIEQTKTSKTRETSQLLSVLFRSGDDGVTWDVLCGLELVTGPRPLNFPKLLLEELKDGDDPKQARYMAKNAFRNINGWVQDLAELGGKATIKVPPAPEDENARAKALDAYLKQGLYMPFAPNNYAAFAKGKPLAINSTNALGFGGGRVGEETASDALNSDAAWASIFPQLLAYAWHDDEQRDRLIQSKAKKRLEKAGTKERDSICAGIIRERDALFADFGYRRPVGLEIEFEHAEAWYDDCDGWIGDLQPILVVRVPPVPADVKLQPIALADYRATGKGQLFTT